MAGVNAVNAQPSVGAMRAARNIHRTGKDYTMPQIGEFTRESFGFSGRIHTLSLDRAIAILPAEPSEAENAPNHRVYLGGDGDGPEIGAAWTRTGEKAGEYLFVLLEDPFLQHPIRANLFQNGSDSVSWSLHSSRPPKDDGED